MSSKVAKLVSAYRQHLTVPWQAGLAAIQRVIFAVYDKADELRLRANVEEFALATRQAGKQWLLLDLTNTSRTGKELEELLGRCNITVNKNTIPGEKLSPMVASGIRIGTPAITTRGMVESDMEQIAGMIRTVIDGGEDVCPDVKRQVEEMMKRFPLYEGFPNE